MTGTTSTHVYACRYGIHSASSWTSMSNGAATGSLDRPLCKPTRATQGLMTSLTTSDYVDHQKRVLSVHQFISPARNTARDRITHALHTSGGASLRLRSAKQLPPTGSLD